MKSLVALVSGFGWHVADLERAAARLEVALHVVPFPQASASIGLRVPGAAGIQAGELDLLGTDGVLASRRRTASPGEWRTKVSLGGHAESYRLDGEAERLAIAAARTVGAEMAGVDLIPDLDRGRLVVLEVNAVPGWRALARVTGI